MIQQMLSSDLFDVVNHIIRANKEARDRVLDWFAAALNINHKRRAMQVDPTTVASDGFMFNLTTCLDKLCEPFMDATFTKVGFAFYLIVLFHQAHRVLRLTGSMRGICTGTHALI
jgi:ubiquitin conjugation factor E4 B